jgi:hypothetical protein
MLIRDCHGEGPWSVCAEQNVAHFRKLLAGDLPPEERVLLENLLVKEAAKLRAIDGARPEELERC